MVAPSLWHEGDPIFTIWQPLIGCMFLGLYSGGRAVVLEHVPGDADLAAHGGSGDC